MLNQEQICKLIPHSGDMCLLDSVKSWDETNIICTSKSHMKKNNPLRNNKGLPMLSLLEYGAQAIAIHGGLLAESDGEVMAEGYLAALREIKITQGMLSDIESELKITAKRIYAEGGNMIYTIMVHANNEVLVSGRANVIAKLNRLRATQ